MPEFYMIIARKIFFPNFWGHVPSLPPSPTFLDPETLFLFLLCLFFGLLLSDFRFPKALSFPNQS